MMKEEGNILQGILDYYSDEEFLLADGFDDAVIGVEEESMRLIYSVSKCIDILCQGLEPDDAIEYFNFNIGGAYMGKKTPIWCYDDFE